ncbi:hypothetical protein OSTOST_21309 [Ostertagia ostertagi]
MRLSSFVLLALIGGCLCYDSVKVAVISHQFSGLPPCAHTCLSDLFVVTADLLSMENTTESFSELCRTYNEAALCVDEQEDCVGGVLFDTIFGGLETLCSEQEDEMEQFSDCLANSTELIVQDCDDNCTFSESITKLSAVEFLRRITRVHRSRDMMFEQLGPVCTATGCMTSCVARGLNEECGEPAGTIVMEAVLRPFIKAATILEELGPRAKGLVARQMPEECRFLVEMEQLQNIINGTEPEEASSEEGIDSGMEGSSNSTMEGSAEGSGGESTGEESGGGEEEKSEQSVRWRGHPLAFPAFNRAHKVVVIATKSRYARSPNSRDNSREVVSNILLGRNVTIPRSREHDSRNDSRERLSAVRVQN